MNSRMNEDLAWLRVQDMQRETENRRLMAGMRRSAGMTTRTAKLGLQAVRTLAAFASRRAGTRSGAPSVTESRHHA
jgi:hypothetical protein